MVAVGMVAARLMGMVASVGAGMMVGMVGTVVSIAHLFLERVALLTRHLYLLRLAHLRRGGGYCVECGFILDLGLRLLRLALRRHASARTSIAMCELSVGVGVALVGLRMVDGKYTR